MSKFSYENLINDIVELCDFCDCGGLLCEELQDPAEDNGGTQQ